MPSKLHIKIGPWHRSNEYWDTVKEQHQEINRTGKENQRRESFSFFFYVYAKNLFSLSSSVQFICKGHSWG